MACQSPLQPGRVGLLASAEPPRFPGMWGCGPLALAAGLPPALQASHRAPARPQPAARPTLQLKPLTGACRV